MNIPPFPEVPKNLLDDLQKRFPERCPDLKDSDREVWFKVGARSVIAFLAEQFRRQNETKR